MYTEDYHKRIASLTSDEDCIKSKDHLKKKSTYPPLENLS